MKRKEEFIKKTRMVPNKDYDSALMAETTCFLALFIGIIFISFGYSMESINMGFIGLGIFIGSAFILITLAWLENRLKETEEEYWVKKK